VQRLRRIEMAGRGRGREIGTTASHVTPHPARERQLDEGRPASAADMPLASSRARDVVAATAPPAAASHSALESISHATARPAMLVPDHEVERLADRVIGTIDRRIVAQRERFGRP
jgi:hypothetical protein